ncbi:UDP-3-O-[3-hydroxymyristoyl] N-acetylglucosamine deacetylase [Rickettsiales endosymbiont of Paramecium tredecaurelia]|uniref:UDP-3-O-acyl-N-acetylglucosamine deacetylase n=1 Tax=Candidatus Sarmatiella mevalonica TaxID=2770581 RepID=UPI001924CF77|nr:UDP-3-O-acyl-N-acetylglucosamine deacetylase [Candidatus Sarmatiella mevalonica]MBL3284194.1 UDP-3-O-[3-hydroxymyristoyl] N-acetylglucosamine deacetylase [Candidatus Sarmatiella mevalonica]
MRKETQRTICNLVNCCGIGIHSGDLINLTIKPAPADTGIVFIRTDCSKNNVIPLNLSNIIESQLCTSITNGYVQIMTVEHLLSAMWALGIDNAVVEVDGREIPIMDGSSQPFLFLMHCAGVVEQAFYKRYLKLTKEVRVECGGSYIVGVPCDSKALNITLSINFDHPLIGHQALTFSSDKSFESEISKARTFGFVKELDVLKSRGVALGAKLENAIALDETNVLNQEGLRYHDEFVRHKMLDSIGDFYCVGNLVANVTSYKPSHALNYQFLQKVMQKSEYIF